jgi:hypothetical protein
MPSISQGIISSIGFGISLIIDVILSLIYQIVGLLGCGGIYGGICQAWGDIVGAIWGGFIGVTGGLGIDELIHIIGSGIIAFIKAVVDIIFGILHAIGIF